MNCRQRKEKGKQASTSEALEFRRTVKGSARLTGILLRIGWCVMYIDFKRTFFYWNDTVDWNMKGLSEAVPPIMKKGCQTMSYSIANVDKITLIIKAIVASVIEVLAPLVVLV